jgi:hypothetical protein
MSTRVAYLDQLIARRGMFIDFYDPDGTRYGLPTYPYRCAPDGLLTMRQLRAKGLRPGGQDIVAQILWRHRRQRRVAYLYREDRSKPSATTAPTGGTDDAPAARTSIHCQRLLDTKPATTSH